MENHIKQSNYAIFMRIVDAFSCKYIVAAKIEFLYFSNLLQDLFLESQSHSNDFRILQTAYALKESKFLLVKTFRNQYLWVAF